MNMSIFDFEWKSIFYINFPVTLLSIIAIKVNFKTYTYTYAPSKLIKGFHWKIYMLICNYIYIEPHHCTICTLRDSNDDVPLLLYSLYKQLLAWSTLLLMYADDFSILI